MEEEGKLKDFNTILKACRVWQAWSQEHFKYAEDGTITAFIICRKRKVSFQRAYARGFAAEEMLGELE